MPSLRKFIAEVARDDAAEFFSRHGVTLESEELAQPPLQLAAIVQQKLAVLPIGTRSKVDQEMETVERLATEAGENAIDSKTLHEHLKKLPSRMARALWVFLHDPIGFRHAEEVIFHDGQRYGRQWTAFAGEPGRDLRTDAKAQEAFKQALKEHFDSANVHLDIFERSRLRYIDETEADQESDGKVDLIQVTIYREARPTVEPTFVESTFTYQTRSPVIEAAVTYEPISGRIECVASQRASRDEVVRQFAIALLGCSPELEPCIQKSYDLSVLCEPVNFDFDDGDGIEKVDVTLLRLKPVDQSPESITIDRPTGSERTIWQVADERLGHRSLATTYQISRAEIAIKWRAQGENRLRSLRVGITHPYKSDIKDQTEIERLVAAKYLPRWGLVVSK